MQSPAVKCFYCLTTVCIVICLSGCAPEVAQQQRQAEKPLESITAEVMTIAKVPWATVVRSQGSLYADEQSVVGSEVAGRVDQVHVDLGDFVRTGDPLVTLAHDDFQLQVEQTAAQLQQARAAVGLRENDSVSNLNPENAPPVRQEKAMLAEAQSSLDRAASLLKENAISKGEYEIAVAAAKVAEARYASSLNSVREKIAIISVQQAASSLARERLENAIIRAPMDGFIRQRQVAPGTYISVGQAIAIVVRTHPLRFRGSVPERYAQSIAVGQEVRLKIESLTSVRKATINRVSPALDQLSRSLAFEALVDNADHKLRTGLFAEAEVVIDAEALEIAISNLAISEFAGAEKVWKVVDGVTREHAITCGLTRDGLRHVTSGLEVGDVILSDATKGKAARIVPGEPASSVAANESETLEVKN
jgi:RND family efflux transporter MFP subunit